MHNKNLNLSVIIPTFNGREDLIACLRSIENQDVRPTEIIVVVNGSTDGTAEYLTRNYPKVKLIVNDVNLGYGKAMSQGVNSSSAEWVWLLNDDTVLSQDSLQGLAIWLRKIDSITNNVAGIFPLVLYHDKPNVINAFGAAWSPIRLWVRDKFSNKNVFDVDLYPCWVLGDIFVAPIFKKDIFLKVGGFCEMMFNYAEDVDLSYRLALSGYRCIAVPDVQVFHRMSRTATRNRFTICTRHRWGTLNYLISLIKNLEVKTLVWTLPMTYARFMAVSIMQGLKTLDISCMLSFLYISMKLVTLLKHVIIKRAEVQSLRQVSDKEIRKIKWQKLIL